MLVQPSDFPDNPLMEVRQLVWYGHWNLCSEQEERRGAGKGKKGRATLQEMVRTLCHRLREGWASLLPFAEGIPVHVLIEQQPFGRRRDCSVVYNNALCYGAYVFFLQLEVAVRLVSPLVRSSVFAVAAALPSVGPSHPPTRKELYATRKRNSVESVHNLRTAGVLAGPPALFHEVLSLDKADDVCDCIIQSVGLALSSAPAAQRRKWQQTVRERLALHRVGTQEEGGKARNEQLWEDGETRGRPAL